MKTYSHCHLPALQADPSLVNKTQRDNLAYVSFGSLPGDQDHDFLHQPDYWPQGPRLAEFTLPGDSNHAR